MLLKFSNLALIDKRRKYLNNPGKSDKIITTNIVCRCCSDCGKLENWKNLLAREPFK